MIQRVEEKDFDYNQKDICIKTNSIQDLIKLLIILRKRFNQTSQDLYYFPLHFIRLFILFVTIMITTDKIKGLCKEGLDCLANENQFCGLLSLSIKKAYVKQ